jgi:5'(3')-deoxyribonucleotidase
MYPRNLRIGLDVDSTFLGFVEAWLDLYNHDYHHDLTKDDITDFDFKGTPIRCSKEEFRRYLNNGYLQLMAKPYQNAVEVVREWAKVGHLPVFITSTNRSVAGEKINKLVMEIGPDIPFEVHFARDKWHVSCDLYVDDSPNDIENYSDRCDPPVPVLVYDQPWNRDVKTQTLEEAYENMAFAACPYGPTRVHDWWELADFVRNYSIWKADWHVFAEEYFARKEAKAPVVPGA